VNVYTISKSDWIRHSIILEVIVKCLKLKYCMRCIGLCACCTIPFLFVFIVVFSLFSCIAFYRLWWIKMNIFSIERRPSSVLSTFLVRPTKVIILSVYVYPSTCKLTTRHDDRRSVTKFSESRVWDRLSDENAVISGDSRFFLKCSVTVYAMTKEATCQN